MKDRPSRVRIEYHRPDTVAKQYLYPIPRMDKCIDSLGEATIFPTLDAKSGYCKAEIGETIRDITAFISHPGLFRYICMLFKLRKSSGTFLRTMDVIFLYLQWQYALVYVDNFVLFSRTLPNHNEHVRKVLTLLRDAGVTLKLKKGKFASGTITFLEHVICTRRHEITFHTTDAIRGLKPPANHTELQSFLRLCSVLRQILPNCVRLEASLSLWLAKDQPATSCPLCKEELNVMNALK